ncbi:MAG: phosphoadenosine phosphosulfate reductase family protein [Desulfovermiculus sp.]|nr:phosphoadenosine phosphosulfate reductase family protein [Desulfovermiculus sp.]
MILEEKIEQSRNIMGQALSMADPSRIAVAWTGGKDSTVVLALWRETLLEQGLDSGSVLALNLDTGLKFPEVIAFRDRMGDEWDLSLSIIRPEVDTASYPVAQDVVQCCADLKIRPLHKAVAALNISLLLTGVRADEHPDRGSRSWLEEKHDGGFSMLHPIIHWTEMDIWSFTLQHGLPYCPLYNQGYRSLGCQPCTRPSAQDERSGREQSKEDKLSILRSLGYF